MGRAVSARSFFVCRLFERNGLQNLVDGFPVFQGIVQGQVTVFQDGFHQLAFLEVAKVAVAVVHQLIDLPGAVVGVFADGKHRFKRLDFFFVGQRIPFLDDVHDSIDVHADTEENGDKLLFKGVHLLQFIVAVVAC